MNTFQQLPRASNARHIDPEKIFPKRLGTYQNGNALVLEYYNLATDKFKKHVIPLDHGKSVKENVDEIYKNPKHGMLLGKVEAKYVEAVVKGESFMSEAQTSNRHTASNSVSYQGHSAKGSLSFSQNQPSFTSQNSQPSYSNNIKQSLYSQQVSNQNSISEIRNDGSSSLAQQVKEKIEQVEEYYEEEFEDFEMSQSMGKKNGGLQGLNNNNNSKKQPQIDSFANNSKAHQPVSMQITSESTYEEKAKQVDDEIQQQAKPQKKEKKSKKAKKSKKQKKQQPSEDQFEFDFLDDDNSAPKDKKPKTKQVSKEKPKKEKSKEKPTKEQKTIKAKIEQKPAKKQEIQQDFDFDL